MAVTHTSERTTWACDNGPCANRAVSQVMPAGWLVVADDRSTTEPVHCCGWRCLAEIARALAGVI